MTKLKRALGTLVISVFGLCAVTQGLAHPKGSAAQTVYGAASWYGAELHGRRTASGERFDSDGLTAAHPTLPFDTRVRVTNQANGKSVVVRINDRGPFSGKRIIDISQRAAKLIGMMERGVGPVKVEVLEHV